MRLKAFTAPLAITSLLFSSNLAAAAPVSSLAAATTAAAAAPTTAAPIAASSSTVAASAVAGCANLITSTGAMAAAQAVRPGCVLPVTDVPPPPVTTEAVPGPMFGSWLLPLLGVAGLLALLVALRGGKDDGSGSISRA